MRGGSTNAANRAIRCSGTVARAGSARRRRLQREQLLPRPRTHGDAVSDRVADQVIQRAHLAVRGKPDVLDVALDLAALLQRTADTHRDLLDQRLQLLRTRLAHRPGHGQPTP